MSASARVADRRDEHGAVERVEVRVRNRDRAAARRTRAYGQHRDLDDLDARPPRAAAKFVGRDRRGSGWRGSSQPWRSAVPGAVNATTLST